MTSGQFLSLRVAADQGKPPVDSAALGTDIAAGDGQPTFGKSRHRAGLDLVWGLLILTALLGSLWVGATVARAMEVGGTFSIGLVAVMAMLDLGVAVALCRMIAERRAESAEASRRLHLVSRLHEIASTSTPEIYPIRLATQMIEVARSDPRLLQLAEIARQEFGMDRAGVLMLIDADKQLELLASCGDMPIHLPSRFSLDDMPACRTAMDSGEPSLIGAAIAGSPQTPRNRGLLAFFHASSAILIPLTVGDERVGLITLSASEVRNLRPSDHDTAMLFSRYAGLILRQVRTSARMAASIAQQRRLVEQRDALWAVNAAAFEASTRQDSLNTIVERAPAALDSDICIIAITGKTPAEMVVIAVTGGNAEDLFPGPLIVTGHHCGQALESRQTIVVTDAADDPRVDAQARSVLPMGSLIYLPLIKSRGVNGSAKTDRQTEVYGIMAMVREKSGPFEPELVALAEVFAARASAVIERARLREQSEQLLKQATQDAETRAVLLSELNHRVKNNLAGIVGLLTARPPGLDADSPARVWLDRVADRVRTMADAHNLFTGAAGAVSIASLIDGVVSGLPIPEDGPIQLAVNVSDVADVSMQTPLAVPLAMVLHELCFNAVSHGLRAGGTLSINAARAGNELELTIRDQGRTSAPDPGSNRHGGGLGLTLVRDLMERELKGTFEITFSQGDGTTAQVKMPLDNVRTSV